MRPLMTPEPRMEHDASQDSEATLLKGRAEVSIQTPQEAPGEAARTLFGLHGGVEVIGTPPEYVNLFTRPLLGEGLVESGRVHAVAEVALAETAPTKEDGVVQEAARQGETHEDAAMDDAVAEEDLPERAFSETQETENDDPDSGGVAKTALPAVFDVETVIAETALAKAASEERSKGNALETSPSAPSFSWSQVLQTMVIDSTLGDDPISLSQCDGFSLSQFLPETPKRNVVIHGAQIVGPVACLPFPSDGMQGGSNRCDAAVGLGTSKHLFPCPSKEDDLQFFDQACTPEYKQLLWSLPGVYEALLEKEEDGTYFIAAYVVMEPSAHPVNTTNAPDWMKFPELSHRTVYEDPRIVAWKLGLVQAAARYRFHSVFFPFNPAKSFVLYIGACSVTVSVVSWGASHIGIGEISGSSRGTS
jgi:hypothetical protein